MADRQFFQWVGNEGDAVYPFTNREEEGVLFEGRFGHIGFTGDAKKIEALKANKAFKSSSAKAFKDAGGLVVDEEKAPEEGGDPGDQGIPATPGDVVQGGETNQP